MGSSATTMRMPLSLLPSSGDAPRILVLGCMGCGKSTLRRQLVKQSRSLGLKNEYYTHTVQYNLLQVWRALRDVCDQLDVDYSKLRADYDILHEFRHREDLSDKVYKSLKAVSRSGLLEECQKKRRVLPLPCNYLYFVHHTERILHRSYVPTEADILFSYAMTVGVIEQTIRIGLSRYDVIELPGHHIWRRKWPDFFHDTTVLCFIVDLSELCQAEFYSGHLKDKTVGIFKELVSNPLFRDTGFLLLFNKRDTFDEHSAGFDFRQLASHIKTSQEALSYYRSQFSATAPKGRTYHHMVSLIKAPNLGHTVMDSLNKIFKQQREKIATE